LEFNVPFQHKYSYIIDDLSEEAVIKWFVSLRFTAEIVCFDREGLQWQKLSALLCARRRKLPHLLCSRDFIVLSYCVVEKFYRVVGVKFKLARIQLNDYVFLL